MIELSNVTFSYSQGNQPDVLKNINLKVKEGEVIVLCGESGCGKTTLTQILNGLIPHYYEGKLSGKVSVGGKEIHQIPLHETAKIVGSVFQNPRSQFFNIDTTTEIAFGGENLGLPVPEILKRIEETVNEFQIQNLMNRSIFALSGGEKQKIACASVSLLQPEVFVLDEPSSNLDIKSIDDLATVISTWKKKGKTVVIAEHRLYYLTNLADRFIYMKEGEIIFDISAKDFLRISDHRKNELGLRSIKAQFFKEIPKDLLPSKKWTLEGLRFCYGKNETLNIPQLSVPQSSIIAVIGNNGSGKSTFARCLCGLEKKAKGTLSMDGVICNWKERLEKSYLVMQEVNHQLFTESVLDEIVLSLKEKNEEKKMQELKTLLQQLNLTKLKNKHPVSLSGGQKQRVAIASAIATGKDIMVFDEPTSGLDYGHMVEVAQSFHKLSNMGKTLFIITHDPELISKCCNYFIFIENGKMLWHGGWSGENRDKLTRFFALTS